MEPPHREWLPTPEALKLAGFRNHVTFLRVVRARKIKSRTGPANSKLYSRATMLELARDRQAAELRRARANGRCGDPLTDPKTSGEIEAEVFALFDKKTEPADVVIQLKLPSAYVDDLFERWWRMRQRGQAWLRPAPPPEGLPLPPVPPRAEEPAAIIVPTVTPRIQSETRDVLSCARAAADAAKAAADPTTKATGT